MKKILTVAVISLLLIACDSDNDTNSEETTIENPSLSEITGIWWGMKTINNESGNVNFVINDYGEMISYDFDSSTFDQRADCYHKDVFSINDLGNGSFEVVDSSNESFTFNVSLSGEQLTWKFTGGELNMTTSSLEESDFTPLCEDISQVTQVKYEY